MKHPNTISKRETPIRTGRNLIGHNIRGTFKSDLKINLQLEKEHHPVKYFLKHVF